MSNDDLFFMGSSLSQIRPKIYPKIYLQIEFYHLKLSLADKIYKNKNLSQKLIANWAIHLP